MKHISEFIPDMIAAMREGVDRSLVEADAKVQAVIEARYAEALLVIKRRAEHDRRSLGQRYRYHKRRFGINE